MSPEALARDERTLDAVIRNLEVIGEAVKLIPAEVREEHEQINWNKIAGLRDILIHRYFGIDVEIIWDVVQNKIPPLEKHVRDALAN